VSSIEETIRLITELNYRTQEGSITWSQAAESRGGISERFRGQPPVIWAIGKVYTTTLANYRLFLYKAIAPGLGSAAYPGPKEAGITLDVTRDDALQERLSNTAGLLDLLDRVENSTDIIGRLLSALEKSPIPEPA